MTLDDFIIQIKVNADGMKQGIEAAQNMLKSIDGSFLEAGKKQQEFTKNLSNMGNASRNAFSGIVNSVKAGLEAFSNAATLKDAEATQKKYTDLLKEEKNRAISVIKSRYTEELRLAEEAANAEIKIYEDRINAINDLLKEQDRGDKDAEQLDKIKRLQEQLKYETDDANRYELQKEIDNELADYNKRKNREALEDEKSTLQEQINQTKNALAERKQALNDLRDAEIKALEDSLQTFIDGYDERQEKATETEAAMTENQKAELDQRAKYDAGYRTEKYKEDVAAAGDTRDLMRRTVNNIISDLWDKINEFASAGRAAGEAWADAFAEAASGMQVGIAGGSGGSSAGTSSNQISQVYQFYTPTATPSQITRAGEQSAIDLLKYI